MVTICRECVHNLTDDRVGFSSHGNNDRCNSKILKTKETYSFVTDNWIFGSLKKCIDLNPEGNCDNFSKKKLVDTFGHPL